MLWGCATATPLRVGTSGDYPPFSVSVPTERHEERGQAAPTRTGIEIELAERVAEELGFRIVWVPFRWPELSADVAASRFDVAMSGVTWRPERAARGQMTRAWAVGGPCTVGNPERGSPERPSRIAVNRGGILEHFARTRFPEAPGSGWRVIAVDDNRSLPRLLATGEVDAFVTDSFEIESFRSEEMPFACEPRTDRKVWWTTPGAPDGLAERLDRFLAQHEGEIRVLRRASFGQAQARSELDHLVDLLDRRLAFMPHVARIKRARGLAIEVPEREAVVTESAARAARAAGLDPTAVRDLFALQIELAKKIQRQTLADLESGEIESDSPLTLEEIRPVLLRLGEQIVEALSNLPPLDGPKAGAQEFSLLESRLPAAEINQLRRAVLQAASP